MIVEKYLLQEFFSSFFDDGELPLYIVETQVLTLKVVHMFYS